MSNSWDLVNESDFQTFVGEKGTNGVATILGVDPTTVRAWKRGERAPNRRFQLALSSRLTNYRSLPVEEVAHRLRTFLEIHGLDVEYLAES